MESTWTPWSLPGFHKEAWGRVKYCSLMTIGICRLSSTLEKDGIKARSTAGLVATATECLSKRSKTPADGVLSIRGLTAFDQALVGALARTLRLGEGREMDATCLVDDLTNFGPSLGP